MEYVIVDQNTGETIDYFGYWSIAANRKIFGSLAAANKFIKMHHLPNAIAVDASKVPTTAMQQRYAQEKD